MSSGTASENYILSPKDNKADICEQTTANANAASADIVDENQPPGEGSGQTEYTQQTSTKSSEVKVDVAHSGDVTNTSSTAPTATTAEASDDTTVPGPDASTTEASADVTDAPTPAEEPNGIQFKELRSNDMEILVEYFGNILASQIVELDKKVQQKPDAKSASFGFLQSEPIDDRPRRTRIHGFVRQRFESRLGTESVDDNSIRIFAAASQNQSGRGYNTGGRGKNQRGRGQKNVSRGGFRGQSNDQPKPKGKVGWEELGGEYLHFTLYKENKDTMEAIYLLAKMARTGTKDFATAGTKDRRAVTIQRVSAYRHQAKNMAELNKRLKYGVAIGDFKHEKYPLRLGDLDGNFFTITLRDCYFGDDTNVDIATRVELAQKVVGDAVEHLQTHGFLNYFGLQRFGTFAIGTHQIGKLILKENYEGAVDALLTFSADALAAAQSGQEGGSIGRDDIGRALAIHKFRETGRNHCRDYLPSRFAAEKAVIYHMSTKHGRTDHVGAIQSIPRHLRTMYVHSYQSFVWNTVASRRWELYGDKVIEGDLVLVASKAPEQKDEIDENGEIVVHASGGDAAVTSDDLFQRARCLSAEEANSGTFTIFDIVLPTPGYDIEYPGNDIGDFYKDFMGSEQGGGLDPANMRRKIKDFSLSGSYRHLIGQVKKGMSFEVKTYHDATEQLVETDMEALNKVNGPRYIETTHVFSRKEGDPHGYANFQENIVHQDDDQQNNVVHQDDRHQSNFVGGQQGGHARHMANAAEEGRQIMAAYGGSAQHKAWKALPDQLAAEDKAAAEAWEEEKSKPVTVDSIKQPILEETYIQTSVGDDGRRRIPGARVHQTIDLEEKALKDAAVAEEKPKVEIVVVPVAGSDDIIENQEGGVKLEAPIGLKRSAEEMSMGSVVEIKQEETETKNIKVKDETVEPTSTDIELGSAPVTEEVSEETRPARLAIVIKFGLGSSMYATMALRELMQRGGVQVYQPDFSSGR